MIHFKVALPYTNHRIATGLQIFISRPVAFLLGNLSISRLRETRVTVPVIAVHFQNQLLDPYINDEFRFNDGCWFKLNTERPQHFTEFSFWLAWLRFLDFAARLNQRPVDSFYCFWVFLSPFLHLGNRFRLFHRVMVQHVLFGFIMYNSVRCRFVQCKTKFVSLISYLSCGFIYKTAKSIAPHNAVAIAQNNYLFACPISPVRLSAFGACPLSGYGVAVTVSTAINTVISAKSWFSASVMTETCARTINPYSFLCAARDYIVTHFTWLEVSHACWRKRNKRAVFMM